MMGTDSAVRRAFDDALPVLAGAAESLRRYEALPGGILVVCARGGMVGAMPFGAADVGARLPVTERHLFEIGSISKVLASVLIGRLVDGGRVDLSDPVVRHLPWLGMGAYTQRITIADLLGHTAGLVSGVDALTDERAQAWSLRHLSAFEPGTRFHYSNVGYVVAGLLVSELEGRHHGDVLEGEVFGPLAAADERADGSTGGGCVRGSIRNADRGRLAVGYAPAADDRPWLPGDAVAPAPWLEAFGADGNVAMDAGGMALLLRLLLGDGSVGATRVIGPDSMRRITTGWAPGGEPIVGDGVGLPVTDSRYGLGINTETIGGAPCLTHGGGMVGYASFVLADPRRDVAVGVMTNADGDCLAAQVLARYAHRVLVSGEPPAPIDRRQVDPALRAAAASASELEGLAGTDASGAEVRVTVDRDVISGRPRCRTAAGTGALWRDAYGRFVTDHPDLRLNYLHRLSSDAASDAAQAVAPDAAHGAEREPRSVGIPLLAGHYRAHNPWFPTFRIAARGARLFLTATGGVEAPSEDEELVPLDDGSLRVGAEPWRPERLRPVAEVDGTAVLVDLGGCRYSRTPAE